jgi:hypothetical protein
MIRRAVCDEGRTHGSDGGKMRYLWIIILIIGCSVAYPKYHYFNGTDAQSIVELFPDKQLKRINEYAIHGGGYKYLTEDNTILKVEYHSKRSWCIKEYKPKDWHLEYLNKKGLIIHE